MTAVKKELPIIIIDTREQKPYKYRVGKSVGGVVHETLKPGDYSLKGYEHLIIIERKAKMDELARDLGKNRARFIRKLELMQSSRRRYLVIEDHWTSIFNPNRHSQMHPNAVFESIIALSIKYGVSVIFAGSRKQGHKIVRSLLLKAFKYREELDGSSSSNS